MDNVLAAKLNPKNTSDMDRQRVVEALVFTSASPDPDLWRALIPILGKEPVKWIRQLEVRLLKRLTFSLDFAKAVFRLLDEEAPGLRLEGAKLLKQLLDRLSMEKKQAALREFENALLPTLLLQLKRKEIIAQQDVWIALYQGLSTLGPNNAVSREVADLLPKGGEAALYVFAQYVQRSHAPECLEAVLSALASPHSDGVSLHLLRALSGGRTKSGETIGYPDTESLIRALIDGLERRSENVRREAADALAARAKSAKERQCPLPLEGAAWEALFLLYKKRLHAPLAQDKNSARKAIAAMPINQERLGRLFDLVHQVEDGHQKQDVVGLIGLFKTPETRQELLRLLRDNFPGLRLDAQKVIIDSISVYLPDEEIEDEMDKLLEGKLHADIFARLGDKLLAPLPSLKKRLLHWLGLNPKTKRPLLERFDLPMMHTRFIQAARRLKDDPEIQERLQTIEPLLMMNDAKVKMHETLKAFPSAPKVEVLSVSALSAALIAKIDPLPKAHVIFSGFSLPKGFGESQELEFGNAEQARAQGLGPGAAEMGKDFVKQAIEDLFSEDSELDLPEGARFRVEEDPSGHFTVTALTS